MADDVILPGTGAEVATDDVGGKHYQKVKLYDPTADSSSGIGITANPIRVDPTGTTTQPVSAASLPLPSGAATEATLSSLNSKVTAVNTGSVTITAALPSGTNNIGDVDVLTIPSITIASQANPFSTAIAVDTELPTASALADNTANPTVPAVGAHMMSFDGTTWDRTKGDSTDGLLVNLGTNNDVTVSGTVTANAGTNLNTSSLNLESTQADIKTAVQLIDDTVTTLGTDTYTEATSKGIILGAVRRDADTTLVNTTNEFSPLQVDANGRLKVEIFNSGDTHTISGTVTANAGTGDFNGALVDGVSSAIKATVLDYTNSNPLAVRLTDTNGDYVSSGAGTEYTEDAAAVADPIGKANILVRKDTPATITSTDGDNIAQRGTNYGAAYCQILTSSGSYVDSFGGGTQYTEADTDATITGTALMWEDTADTLRPASVAKPLPVDIAKKEVITASGSLTALNDAITITDLSLVGSVTIQLVATFSLTAIFEGTIDGSNWVTVSGSNNTNGASGVTSTTINTAIYTVPTTGLSQFRVRCSAYTSGTATVSIRGQQNDASVYIAGISVTPSPGTGNTSFGKSEDAAHVDTSTGVFVLAVRQDTLSSSVDTDGDYAAFKVDSVGALHAADRNALTDNGSFTDGTSKVFTSGYIFDETPGTALTENDVAAARINSNRAQIFAIEDGSTRGRWATVTASNALKVDGSAVNQPVKEVRGTATSAANVAGSASSVTILASNANRIKATVFNDSTAILYLLEGSSSASTSNFHYKLQPDGLAIISDYTGQINGIWASATGNARVGETT